MNAANKEPAMMTAASRTYSSDTRRAPAALVPEPRFCGANKKPGKCGACGVVVPVGAGNLFRSDFGWAVYHANGCR